MLQSGMRNGRTLGFSASFAALGSVRQGYFLRLLQKNYFSGIIMRESPFHRVWNALQTAFDIMKKPRPFQKNRRGFVMNI